MPRPRFFGRRVPHPERCLRRVGVLPLQGRILFTLLALFILTQEGTHEGRNARREERRAPPACPECLGEGCDAPRRVFGFVGAPLAAPSFTSLDSEIDAALQAKDPIPRQRVIAWINSRKPRSNPWKGEYDLVAAPTLSSRTQSPRRFRDGSEGSAVALRHP